jgi:nicotinate-nucleotide adenylyltransferase
MQQRIGVFGGTFDPIHFGHLAIAEEVRWSLDIDYVYFIPAAQQPLKQGYHYATPQQRLEMVQLACANNAAFVPSDIELRRSPPSYTVDTLLELRETIGDDVDLHFILGSDAFLSFPKWHAAQQIIRLARLVVLARPGTVINIELLEGELPGISSRTTGVIGPQLDIASSMLRQRLANGQPVRYQMPEVVLDYIEHHELYRSV